MISIGARAKRYLALAAVSGLALTTASLTASYAAVGNPYNIDGSVPDPGTTAFADPYGNSAELGPVNSSTTKLGVIHTAPKPMLATSNPNGQVDLRNIWLDSQTDDSGDVWLYLGWERDSNKGSGVITYEFQQAPEPAGCDYSLPISELISGCNPFENRQPGDFIMVWDQSGNTAQIILREWTYTDTNGNGTWDKATEPLTLTAGTTLAGDDAYAMYSADRYFGEASVNLSDTIFAKLADSCLTIGNVIPGTVTGNSDTADYKDVVLADFSDHLTLSNCGSLAVTKVTDPANLAEGDFTYTATRTDGSALRYASDGYSGAGLMQVTETRTGAGAFPNNPQVDLKTGTNYTMTETINGAFDLESIVCSVNGQSYTVKSADVTAGTFPIVAGETTQCTITNKQQQGTLVVTKKVINDNGGTLTASDFSAKVDDSAPVKFTPSAENPLLGSYSIQVRPGTYAVTEPEADSRGYATTYGDNCLAVTVPAGGTATCAITNDDKPAHLTLVKKVVNDNGGTAQATDWTLTASAGGTAVISGTTGAPAVTNAAVSAGSYDLAESTGPAGYTPGAWVCEGGTQTGSAISLALGESATCVIPNDDTKGTPTGSTVQRWVLHDSLTIAGLREGAPTAGTATFKAYSDAQCQVQVGSDETVALSGATATTVNGVPVAEPGSYYWTVTYSGDDFNNGFTTACGEEVTTITAKDAQRP